MEKVPKPKARPRKILLIGNAPTLNLAYVKAAMASPNWMTFSVNYFFEKTGLKTDYMIWLDESFWRRTGKALLETPPEERPFCIYQALHLPKDERDKDYPESEKMFITTKNLSAFPPKKFWEIQDIYPNVHNSMIVALAFCLRRFHDVDAVVMTGVEMVPSAKTHFYQESSLDDARNGWDASTYNGLSEEVADYYRRKCKNEIMFMANACLRKMPKGRRRMKVWRIGVSGESILRDLPEWKAPIN